MEQHLQTPAMVIRDFTFLIHHFCSGLRAEALRPSNHSATKCVKLARLKEMGDTCGAGVGIRQGVWGLAISIRERSKACKEEV